MKKSIGVRIWRISIIAVVSFYLLMPLYAMFDFSTKQFGLGGKSRNLDSWRIIPSQPDLAIAITRSLLTALIVMALILFLIVPTAIWVHLKLPLLRRPFELLCLLPLAIPAIVIVVGIAPLYRWISINLTESPITLSGVYSMLILPYTYRSLSAALDAVDIHTLAEAARTLGASIGRVIFGIIMPTIKTGIINGSFIAIALVLGEYTISNILNYKTFQVVIAQIGRANGNVAVAVSLASLLFVLFLLLLIPNKKRLGTVLDVDVK
ncbi:MAG: ABC transporter permease subunit [Candidatus Planktophila sp.]|nr:ABC transporter permease subunit [Candidatus Planktophila sp.]MDP1851659.1 ABC transporter permease subunit [Candidatus Planktophila sp.]